MWGVGGCLFAQTWDGGGTDNNWSTLNNWNPDAVPGSGANVIFDGTTRTMVNVGWSPNVNRITFAATAGAFTLDGGGLTLGSGGIVNNSSQNQTFTGQVSGTALNISGTGSGRVTFAAASSLGSFSSTTINTSGSVVFGGAVHSGGALTLNNGNVTISGNGTANFSSATVNGGSLYLNRSGGYAINGNLTVNSGGSVTFGQNYQFNSGGTTLTLAAGSYINLNDTKQNFQNLVVTGNAIIDFGEGGGSSLTIANWHGITIADGATLTIKNWNSTVDYFAVGEGYSPTILPKIIFEGHGGATWSGGYVTPGSPIPEPGSYGLLAVGGLVAWVALRRKPRGAVSVGSSK